MIHAVFLTYGEQEAGWEAVSSMYCALSAGRRSKSCGIRDPGAFKTSVIAGRLLEKHLTKLTGLETAALAYSDGGSGRPRLSSAGNIDFNISHTEKAVLAVFKLFGDGEAPHIPCVGCDIERAGGRFRKPGMPESIVNRFFADGEKKLFTALLRQEGLPVRPCGDNPSAETVKGEKPAVPGDEELFFRFWTAKEAYGKMTGQGITKTLGRETLLLREGVPVYSDGSVLIFRQYEDLIMTVAADSRLKDQPVVFTRETVSGLLQ